MIREGGEAARVGPGRIGLQIGIAVGVHDGRQHLAAFILQ